MGKLFVWAVIFATLALLYFVVGNSDVSSLPTGAFGWFLAGVASVFTAGGILQRRFN